MGGSARFLGGTGGKIAKYGKIVIFRGLKQGIFQAVPDASEHSILHLFSQIPTSTKKVQTLYFWTNFKQFLHF